MVYKWKSGSYLKGDPQKAGEVCASLEAKGELNAQKLVDVSRDENAPLHNYFEWRDDVAAEEYRKHQARHIINCITVSDEQIPEVKPRAFFNLGGRSEPEYKSIQTILKSSDDEQRLLKKAYEEMSAFRKKYYSLSELSKLFAVIDEIEEERREANA